MARPREFQIEDAIEKAMGVFWKHGYAGASLPDLLDGMSIARGSFYKAFGSKKELFLLTLDRYDRDIFKPAVAMLNANEGDGIDRITAIFSGSLQRALEGDRNGCLLCNTVAENGDADPDITGKIDDQLSRLTAGFAAALQDSMTWASATEDAREAQANALTLSYVGLRILSKSNGPAALEWGVERTLSMLRREN